ncbi:MAG: hypothetical protein AB2L26_12885 [Ignavibacteria bacterium]
MIVFNRILPILGFLCFVTTCALSLTFMCFFNKPDIEVKVVLIPDAMTLWLVNAVFGILGGVLLQYKKILSALPSGLMAAMVITDSTLLYVSWRSTILNIEMLIPLAAGAFTWGIFFNGLNRMFYPQEESSNKSKINIKSL